MYFIYTVLVALLIFFEIIIPVTFIKIMYDDIKMSEECNEEEGEV